MINKAMYFMGWARDMWNYHPSLPMKNMQMVEDIADSHVNMIIWSCLGSGAIGLPYMDLEANGDTPPRMRLYGFMNDKEFCEECRKRGIRVFAVLWKAQLWEFGAEFNEDESRLLSLNILRGASDNHKYVGMSELSTNRYPKIFPPIEKFFPEGLRNYKGELVGDFLEEFQAKSLEGRPILSAWLMAPDHDHKCYAPCANKDSYVAYMKRDIEMMIDAGAGGLHIDEYDTQKHVTSNAGCFCDECVEKFRRYLKKKNIALPEDAGDLETFNYREYLLSHGYGDKDILGYNGNARWEIPLYRAFTDMHMDTLAEVVCELSTHARAYALEKNGDDGFLVTSNLYNCLPMTGPVRKYLDLFAGEKSGLGVRQDGWYKFCYGWLNGKESCLVEDPNVYIRGVNTDIKNGINDRFILFMMEPYAHGLTMSFPYGSWLQNQVKDAFWPDMRLVKQLGTWLDEHDYLFPKNPAADIAVIYDQPSAYENMMTEPSRPAPIAPGTLDLTGVTELGRIGGGAPSGNFRHFFDIIQKLCDKAVLYNVLYQCEDDPMSAQRLAAYKTVILPDAFLARSEDVEVLHDFAARGGKIFTLGRCPKGLEDVAQPAADCEEILCRIGEDKGPVVVPESDGYGIALHKTEKGYVLNLVNYNYNEETHRIDPLDAVPCKLSFAPKALRAHAFPKNENLCVKLDGQNLEIQNAGIFTGIELEL